MGEPIAPNSFLTRPGFIQGFMLSLAPRAFLTPASQAKSFMLTPVSQAKKLAVDGRALVSYATRNTGKEVILKYMSSNHSEVAAA
jgi:hypothetical protein